MPGHRHAMVGQQDRVASVHGDAATTNDQPCKTPARAECCQAMTSCAISAAFARGDRLASVSLPRDVIEPGMMRVPLSPITSPDPPPPRA